MISLRWRIAASYALLLALASVAIGITIVLAFQGILYAQVKVNVDRTMSEIVASAQTEGNPFSVGTQTESALDTLLDSANIEHWASPRTYVQIDSVAGAVLAKSTNLGGARFAAATDLASTTYRTLSVAGAPFLVEDRMVAVGASDRVVVHVGEPLDTLQRAFAQAQRAIATILVLALVAVLALSVFLATQMVEPINRLAREMRAIGSDRLDRRLGWSGRRDEIGQLAASFDDLLGRLEEGFARERQFISDASHELRTPLTSIHANAQLLLRWGDRDERIRRESLETIARESGSLAAMVDDMLTLAKADRGDPIPKEPIRLAEIAAQAVRASALRASEKGLLLRLAPASDATMLGERNLIGHLVSNLIDNAIKFTDAGGIEVGVGSDEHVVWLEVTDTGPGIAADELPAIFDRFYRADKSRSRATPGTGLGLAIVRSIARVHDGRVAARSSAAGTTFRATFPRLLTQSS